jgi:hypothetical protein
MPEIFNPKIYILNPGWSLMKLPVPDPHTTGIFAPLAQANGGQFKSDLGITDVLVDAHPNHAIFAFRVNDEPAALAAAVWEPSPQTTAWNDLLEAHRELMQNPEPDATVAMSVPQAIPWLVVSIHHAWAKAADDFCRQQIIIQLWAMSLAIHAHQQRSLAKN